MNPIRFIVLFSCFMISSAFNFLFTRATESCSITLQISGCRNSNGYVLVSLFSAADGFPSKAEKAVKKGRLPIQKGSAMCTWSELPKGRYAIAVLHDEDNNQRMTTSFLGLPKEGYGFSNNVTGFMGPPSFEKASFSVDGTITAYINMHY